MIGECTKLEKLLIPGRGDGNKEGSHKELFNNNCHQQCSFSSQQVCTFYRCFLYCCPLHVQIMVFWMYLIFNK